MSCVGCAPRIVICQSLFQIQRGTRVKFPILQGTQYIDESQGVEAGRIELPSGIAS